MSKKKIVINIVLFFCIIVCTFLSVYKVQAEEFNEINFNVINTEEDYKLYLLLPENYINYLNSVKGTNFKITDIAGNEKAKTAFLSYFNVASARKDLYQENGVKYLQVELTNVAHNFIFYVAPGYLNMDIKLRYTSTTRDIILHLNNFSYNVDGVCKVTYDYLTNDYRTDDVVKKSVNKYVVILGILLLVMCIVNMSNEKGKAKAKRRN